MIRLAILLLFIVTLQSFAQSEKEAYTIYSLILNEEIKNDSVEQTIIIQSQTSTQHAPASIEAIIGFVKIDQSIFCSYPENINEILKIYPEIKSLLLNLNRVRNKHAVLSKKFSIDVPYKLIDPKDFFARFKRNADEGWQNLNAENPDLVGVVEFSPVVINGNFASVYFGYQRDAFHGTGSLIILMKVDGQWKIISNSQIWVS